MFASTGPCNGISSHTAPQRAANSTPPGSGSRQAGSRNMASLAHRLGYSRTVRYAVRFAGGKAGPVTVARKVPLLTRAVLPARPGRCETNQS